MGKFEESSLFASDVFSVGCVAARLFSQDGEPLMSLSEALKFAGGENEELDLERVDVEVRNLISKMVSRNPQTRLEVLEEKENEAIFPSYFDEFYEFVLTFVTKDRVPDSRIVSLANKLPELLNSFLNTGEHYHHHGNDFQVLSSNEREYFMEGRFSRTTFETSIECWFDFCTFKRC